MWSRLTTRQGDKEGDQEFSSLPSWRAVPEIIVIFEKIFEERVAKRAHLVIAKT